MTLKQKLEDILDAARCGIIYDEEKADFKSRLLRVYVAACAILDAPEEPTVKRERFALQLPPHQVWVPEDQTSEGRYRDGRYVLAPERTVYFIDGYITESKILAIKQVRTLDGCGLKEAKDFVDGLAAKPRSPSRG